MEKLSETVLKEKELEVLTESAHISNEKFRKLPLLRKPANPTKKMLLQFLLANQEQAFDVKELAMVCEMESKKISSWVTQWRKEGFPFGIRTYNSRKFVGLL